MAMMQGSHAEMMQAGTAIPQLSGLALLQTVVAQEEQCSRHNRSDLILLGVYIYGGNVQHPGRVMQQLLTCNMTVAESFPAAFAEDTGAVLDI